MNHTMKNVIFKQEKYTQISNEIIEDKRLSTSAFVFFCQLKSLSENFTFNRKTLSKLFNRSERQIANCITQLKKYNYLKIKHDKDKKIYIYELIDNPSLLNIKQTKPKPTNIEINKTISSIEYAREQINKLNIDITTKQAINSILNTSEEQIKKEAE